VASLVAFDVVLVAVSLALLVQRRRDLKRLRSFARGALPISPSQKELLLDVARRCYQLPALRKDASFCPPLFAPLGATPSAVLRFGDCCSGRARLLILALHELGIRAYQITLYHRAGHAQHCLVEACLDNGRMIVDPFYGVYYEGPNGDPVSLRELRRGILPTYVPLLDDRVCGYPANDYYDFDFRLSKTANWTKSRLRNFAYTLLHKLTDGGIDHLEVPAVLEWPQHLFIALALLCAMAVNGTVMLASF
jgi:hypothetical protein